MLFDHIFTTDRIHKSVPGLDRASGGQVLYKHYTHGPLGVLMQNAECIKTSIITQIVPAGLSIIMDNG